MSYNKRPLNVGTSLTAHLLYSLAFLFALGHKTASAIAPLQFDLKVLSSDLEDSEIPVVGSDDVIWTGRQNGERRLYRYNISSATRSVLPDNSGQPGRPVIDGSYAAWEGLGITLYDLSNGAALSLSADPRSVTVNISGNNVVWLEGHAQDTARRIMYYNISTHATQQLVNFTDVNNLRIAGSDIVWDGRTGAAPSTSEVFHYSLATGITTRLTVNSVPDVYPEIDAGNVVWQTFDTESTSEIFLRRLQLGVTERLTTNSVSDRTPEISGDNVVWQQGGAVNNVLYRNLATGITTPLTHATTYPESHGVPKVSDTNVMWFGDVGPSALDREVYYYDLVSNALTRVTTNSFFEQYGDISGQNIVFLRDRSLQTNRWDVVLATPIPEPSAFVLLFAAVTLVSGAFRLRTNAVPFHVAR